MEKEDRRCEVCGRRLKELQKRYCSSRCKNLSQTRIWQIIKEVQSTGKVTFAQLSQMVEKRFGRKFLEKRIAEVIKISKEVGKDIEIVIGEKK